MSQLEHYHEIFFNTSAMLTSSQLVHITNNVNIFTTHTLPYNIFQPVNIANLCANCIHFTFSQHHPTIVHINPLPCNIFSIYTLTNSYTTMKYFPLTYVGHHYQHHTNILTPSTISTLTNIFTPTPLTNIFTTRTHQPTHTLPCNIFTTRRHHPTPPTSSTPTNTNQHQHH
jgi:hypothetical protein